MSFGSMSILRFTVHHACSPLSSGFREQTAVGPQVSYFPQEQLFSLGAKQLQNVAVTWRCP